MNETAAQPLPVTTYVAAPTGAPPYLKGSRCKSCGAVYLGDRIACGACGARSGLDSTQLANRGVLHAYSIVYRSFPGVKTPFISAIVDLDGGGSLKGTLRGIEISPAAVRLGMSVKVVFDDAGRTDSQGRHYLAYFFEPAA